MSNGSADTYGWDTVYAVRITDVNELIAGNGMQFQITASDPLTSISYIVYGGFLPWSVTTGGSGELLNVLLPIEILSIDTGDGTKNVAMFGVNGQVVVQLTLEFVLAGSAADNNGSSYNLQVKSSSTGSSPAVTILSVSFDDANFPSYKAFVQSALQTWINQNVDKFGGIFASVNLNRTADQGQFAFLYPTSVSYAYIDQGTLDTSLLGVLCMTGGRSAEGLQSQISPNAIPDGARAGFLISQDRFLKDLIAPALPNALPGLQEGSIQSSVGGLTLGQCLLAPVSHNGSFYPVQLTSGSVSVTDTQLSIDTNTVTMVDNTFGIVALCTSGATYQIQVMTQSSGAQTLGFTQLSSYAQHRTESSSKTAIMEDVAKLAIALIALVLGFLLDGIGAIIAGLLMGILTGVVQTAPDRIAEAGTDDAPSVDALLQNSTALIAWSDTQDFKLTSAALNGSLQLGGTIIAS